MDHPVTSKPLPVYMTLKRWNAFTGMTPTDTYEAIVFGHLVTIRPGRERLVNVAQGLEYLRQTKAPPAETLARLQELGITHRYRRRAREPAPA